MVSRSELKEELIKAGIRPSVQRLAIFEYVRRSCQHPTAEVVYEALRDELGSLSLTTVYNTLKLFVDAGLIMMLTIDDTFRCFDGNCCSHAHFRCNECGNIREVANIFGVETLYDKTTNSSVVSIFLFSRYFTIFLAILFEYFSSPNLKKIVESISSE